MILGEKREAFFDSHSRSLLCLKCSNVWNNLLILLVLLVYLLLESL